jgi:hypothetical protein
MTHGAPWFGERGFAAAIASKIGALQAGELAGEIGDDAEKRRPGLARRGIIRTVEIGGMKAKRGQVVMARPRR